MITIKKIAELTGVSIGAVDRVLHDRGRVSETISASIPICRTFPAFPGQDRTHTIVARQPLN